MPQNLPPNSASELQPHINRLSSLFSQLERLCGSIRPLLKKSSYLDAKVHAGFSCEFAHLNAEYGCLMRNLSENPVKWNSPKTMLGLQSLCDRYLALLNSILRLGQKNYYLVPMHDWERHLLQDNILDSKLAMLDLLFSRTTSELYESAKSIQKFAIEQGMESQIHSLLLEWSETFTQLCSPHEGNPVPNMRLCDCERKTAEFLLQLEMRTMLALMDLSSSGVDVLDFYNVQHIFFSHKRRIYERQEISLELATRESCLIEGAEALLESSQPDLGSMQHATRTSFEKAKNKFHNFALPYVRDSNFAKAFSFIRKSLRQNCLELGMRHSIREEDGQRVAKILLWRYDKGCGACEVAKIGELVCAEYSDPHSLSRIRGFMFERLFSIDSSYLTDEPAQWLKDYAAACNEGSAMRACALMSDLNSAPVQRFTLSLSTPPTFSNGLTVYYAANAKSPVGNYIL